MNRLFVSTSVFFLVQAFGCSSPAPQIVLPPTPADSEVSETAGQIDSATEPGDDPRVGRFVRYDLVTPNAKLAASFYKGLFGWEIDGQEGGIISFENEEIGRIHLSSNMTRLKPGWVAYIAVASVDDVAVDVVGNSGEIVRAATATNGSREAIVRGPGGGAFGMRELAASDTARELGARQGSVYWPQLWTSNLADALSFFQVIGEYTSVEFRFGAIRYQVFKASNGASVGAVVNTPTGQRNRWIPFVRVDDMDGTVATAKRLGAKIVTKPREIAGIGRLASLSTPSGGVIGIITPTPAESETDE